MISIQNGAVTCALGFILDIDIDVPGFGRVPTVRDICYNTEWKTSAFSLDDNENVLQIHGPKPIKMKVKSLYGRWNNFVNIAANFYKGLKHSTPKKENHVLHSNLHGVVTSKMEYFRPHLYEYGITPTNDQLHRRHYSVQILSNKLIFLNLWVTEIIQHSLFGLYKNEVRLKAEAGGFDWAPGARKRVYVLGVEVRYPGIKITFMTYYKPGQLDMWVSRCCAAEISFTSTRNPNIDLSNIIPASIVLDVALSQLYGFGDPIVLPGTYHPTRGDAIAMYAEPLLLEGNHCTIRDTFFVSQPAPGEQGDVRSFVEDIGFDVGTGELNYGHHDLNFRKFAHKGRFSHKDFMGGCYYSGQDAIEKTFDSVTSQYFQSLYEVRDIATLLPVADIKKIIMELKRTKGKIGILKILKILSNANLLYNFGYKPTIGDAQNFPKIRGVIDRLKKLEGKKTYYGSKTFEDVPFGTEKVTVKCTTKIVIMLDIDTLLLQLLTLDSLGLLPKGSNLWAVVPWSWLLDSFVDVGGGIQTVENSVKVMCLNVLYSVSSVKITRHISDEVIESYGLEADSNLRPSMTSYYRFVQTGGAPLIGPTRLPVMTMKAMPSWDILGSLIIQML